MSRYIVKVFVTVEARDAEEAAAVIRDVLCGVDADERVVDSVADDPEADEDDSAEEPPDAEYGLPYDEDDDR